MVCVSVCVREWCVVEQEMQTTQEEEVHLCIFVYEFGCSSVYQRALCTTARLAVA